MLIVANFFSGRFGDQVISTVLNINDSKTAALLNNFNVSKDEILRRIASPSPAMNNANTRTTSTERINIDANLNPATESTVGIDPENQG